MRTCYNKVMYYLLVVYYRFCKEYPPYGELSSVKFDKLGFEEKKTYLKEMFEKSFPAFVDYVSLWTTKYECWYNAGKLNEKQIVDYQRIKEVSELADKIFCSIQAVESKGKSSAKPFNCFLHPDNNPSMTYFVPAHGFKCFGCGGVGEVTDIFNLISLKEEWEGKDPLTFGQAFKQACEWYVKKEEGEVVFNMFSNGVGDNNHTHDYIPYTREMNKTRHNNFLSLVELKNDVGAMNYLESRGIDKNVAIRTGVMVQYPCDKDTKESYGRGYITFINGNGSYVRRLFKENKELSSTCPFKALKWWNSKETGVFNEQVISHALKFGECVFVCEGAIDALSCETLGYHAIALNSVDNAGAFLKSLSEENMVKYICLADNDNAGWSMAEQFKNAHLFISDHFKTDRGILSRCKDVNECLTENPYELDIELKKLVAQANEFYKY